MDARAPGLILLIARRLALALALVASFICAVAVMSVGPAAAALPPASAAVVGSAAGRQDASALESSLGLDRAARRPIQRGLSNEGFNGLGPPPIRAVGPLPVSRIPAWHRVIRRSPTNWIPSLNGGQHE